MFGNLFNRKYKKLTKFYESLKIIDKKEVKKNDDGFDNINLNDKPRKNRFSLLMSKIKFWKKVKE